MATYSYVKTVLDTGPIWDAIGVTLMVPAPDSIDHEILNFHGQEILNPNRITFTFASSLSGGEVTALNSFMSSLDQQSNDTEKQMLAALYTNACFQIMSGLHAKMLEDGKSDFQTNQWFTQTETIVNALNAGWPTVALDRLTSLTSTLINILTGTWTSGEVTELRQTLQKILGKTVT